jgi:hypothetical protein
MKSDAIAQASNLKARMQKFERRQQLRYSTSKKYA